MAKIKTISIEGFKSIRSLDAFELHPMNVLIGANGAGKSNFIGALRFLCEVAGDNFPGYVARLPGKAGSLLFGGSKQTRSLRFEVKGQANDKGVANGYRVRLDATADGRFVFADEATWIAGQSTDSSYRVLGRDHEQALLRTDATPVARHVRKMMQSWRQYHFHDTSEFATVKQPQTKTDTLRLKADAGNVAPYLGKLRHAEPRHYSHIVETIRLVAPFFGDFVHRDDGVEPSVALEWTHRADPDTPYGASALSDGTLRFICLATLLLQPPKNLPDTVLIDEPELGLHPYAIDVLADMLKQVSEHRQVIVSTQSVGLLNAMEPDDVIVVERQDNESTFSRLDTDALAGWLETFTPLGDLWLRNALGGRP